MRDFKEIGVPGGKVVKLYKYKVSFNDGKNWEEMYLADDEVRELRDEFGTIIE